MIGEVLIMELKTGWKTLCIFMFLVLLVAGGFTSMFTMIEDLSGEDLEGMENVNITIPEEPGEGFIEMNWTALPNATSYVVIEDNASHLMSPERIHPPTNATNISIPYDFNETHYFGIIASFSDNSTELVGLVSSKPNSSPWDDFMNDPAFAAFAGDAEIDLTTIKGFMSVEFFSLVPLYFGLFLAYLSSGSISSDYDGKRMDLIFSNPISREQYLMEKFGYQALVSFLAVFLAAGAMASTAASIGHADAFTFSEAFTSMIGCFPMLLAIQAAGFLGAVFFQNGKLALGISMLFVFLTIVFKTVSAVSDSLENLKYLSLQHYWDYNGMLYDGVFDWSGFAALFVITGALLAITIYLFREQDIPA